MALSYEDSGVRYDTLDAFKRACQQHARTTTEALKNHGLAEPSSIRGESAYLIETPDSFLAHVEEGLGTKNLVADEMQRLTGRSWYHGIGVDTVATIVNDMITTGALPLSVAMHAGVGDSRWFADSQRADDLARGFAEGCRRSNAAWGGGETPALKGVIEPHAIVLAGSAIGQIRPKSLRIAGDVLAGDVIIFLASSGVQTNGLTLCRKIADSLPQTYLAPMCDGRAFGDALLDPSVIYVRFVAECQRQHVPIRYAVHVTGHGWRKLMRLDEPFVYRMTAVREPPEVFRFMVDRGPVEAREAYATFNMGAGFAVYVRPAQVDACLAVARDTGYEPWVAGVVEKDGLRRAVIIEPLNITFESDTLQVR